MSATRERFRALVLDKKYTDAVITLNGLNMAEMLRSLAAIGVDHRLELIKALLQVLGQVNAPRIQYALGVVQDLLVPAAAPGDLQATAQVDVAKAFVAIPSIAPQSFTAADDAAIEIVSLINPTSIAQNREFWGLIFLRGKTFSFTLPTRSADENAATPVVRFPAGTTGVAVYHTHGAGFERINRSTAAEIFSIDDRMMCKKHDVDGYLGTPQSHILKLSKPPASARRDLTQLGKVSTLR
jgi:hypothetical protein